MKFISARDKVITSSFHDAVFSGIASDGGLFIPTNESFILGDKIVIDLQLPGETKSNHVEGKVIWITPKNALYQILPGIGVELIGANAKTVREQIKANLDKSMDIGAYVCGMSTEIQSAPKMEFSKK